MTPKPTPATGVLPETKKNRPEKLIPERLPSDPNHLTMCFAVGCVEVALFASSFLARVQTCWEAFTIDL
jgi:hypothetical protein